MEAVENLRSGVMGRPASFYRQLAWIAMCIGLFTLGALTVWEFSFPDYHLGYAMLLIATWAAASIGWLAYVLVRSAANRSISWFRWTDALVGVAAAVALLLVFLSVPFEVRFLATEAAMTADAKQIMGSPASADDATSIGHWPATEVETFDGGMRFLIPDIGWLDPVGFAYSVDGPPPNLGGEDIYYRQSKNWWVWRESW